MKKIKSVALLIICTLTVGVPFFAQAALQTQEEMERHHFGIQGNAPAFDFAALRTILGLPTPQTILDGAEDVGQGVLVGAGAIRDSIGPTENSVVTNITAVSDLVGGGGNLKERVDGVHAILGADVADDLTATAEAIREIIV